MTAQPVEWVLVVYYGPSVHQAVYGRQVRSGGYTKDYIQLSKRPEFLEAAAKIFAVSPDETGSVPITYRWPGAVAAGAFVFKSADRPHLKWETSVGAPHPWKMSLSPSDAAPETIPGDPSHLEFAAAENEFSLLAERGAGQPYLIVVKLRDEPRTLHLRAYLKEPAEKYAWADLRQVPQEIQALAEQTSQGSTLAWSLFSSGGSTPTDEIQDVVAKLAASGNAEIVIEALGEETVRGLIRYLRSPGYGVFFNPAMNHDAWTIAAPLPMHVAEASAEYVAKLEERFPTDPEGDAAAESLPTDVDEVRALSKQIEEKNYSVPDATSTVKTRGSAQKVFAEAVKKNYGYRCALTGIVTRNFLVASHIVPWSEDQSIRLDPSNGICLSLFVDRAFEKGYLQIKDDLVIRIDWDRVGGDEALRAALEPFEARVLTVPSKEQPNPSYLARRRALVASKGSA